MSAAADGTALQRIERAQRAARGRLRGGPAWEARRAAALGRLLERGLPDRRDENWKYLDWPRIDGRDFALPPDAPADGTLPAGAMAGLDATPTLVLVNGRFVPRLSSASGLPGLEVEGLAAALERDPQGLAEALRVPGDHADERFALLAEAFVDDGLVIRIADGMQAESPLLVLHLGTGDAVSHTRVLVRAGRNSRLQLVEHFLGADGASGLANLVCEIDLAAGASLDHIRLHHQQPSAAQVETLSVSQGADSRYRQQLFMLGGQLLRSNLHLRLEGTGAECAVHGLLMVDGTRQADLYTVIEHVAAHTSSDELVRCVATDRGRGAFNGRVLVGPQASKTDARQSNRNLILSPLAEINSRPQLEILTDDVKCSHGSTTGSLDASQLFYLLSRGIDRKTARGLLTFAFCEDVVSRIALPGLRRYVEELVVGRLPERDVIREFV